MDPEKYLQLTFSDGQVWEVKARIIAEDRARYYAERAARYDGKDRDTVYYDELAITLENHDLLIDWFEGNMDWADIEMSAFQMKPPTPLDLGEACSSAEKKVVTQGGVVEPEKPSQTQALQEFFDAEQAYHKAEAEFLRTVTPVTSGGGGTKEAWDAYHAAHKAMRDADRLRNSARARVRL